MDLGFSKRGSVASNKSTKEKKAKAKENDKNYLNLEEVKER